MTSSTNKRPIYAVIAVVAVVATLFGISNGRILGVSPTPTPDPRATAAGLDPVDAHPAPGLFKAADLVTVSAAIDPEFERAESNIDDFYAGQSRGRSIDDAAFATWASRQLTGQPSAFTRGNERAQLGGLSRSAKREQAARWLGLYGCRDVWSSLALEQKRFHAADDLAAKRSEMTEVLNLAARVATAAANRFDGDDSRTARAPCAPTTPPAADEGCGCSFPSSAAVMAAAARTYLTAFEPEANYRYASMEQQVDLAAVYQGLELPSDVKAGAYLGYLTGRYFLATRGYPPPTIPTPTPTTTP